MANSGRQGTRIHSVLRAAQLLMLMASLPEQGRSINWLATDLGTSVPTFYHLLNTLVDAKMLPETTPAVHSPPELLRPLPRVIDTTGETAYLSVWRHGAPVILARLRAW